MSELSTLKARLAEAEEKLHQIQVNQQVTQTAFSAGGQHSVSKQPLDAAKLQNYIGQLKIQIARLEGRGSGRVGQVLWT